MEPWFGRLERVLREERDFGRAAQETCRTLRAEVPRYNWVGVYMIEGGDTLVLKAWDGSAATEHVRIPIGQGICGLAAREARTVVVDDVNKDPRYLACFLQTRSEIVVPIISEGRVVGEIDIDSDRPAAFTEADRKLLESVAEQLGKASARIGR
ncbi:MAG TPA: GAF domain-containing protein [Planctomycetota bacterium]|nr:GAF domain-containing protein [Planctomycetota bacterium]